MQPMGLAAAAAGGRAGAAASSASRCRVAVAAGTVVVGRPLLSAARPSRSAPNSSSSSSLSTVISASRTATVAAASPPSSVAAAAAAVLLSDPPPSPNGFSFGGGGTGSYCSSVDEQDTVPYDADEEEDYVDNLIEFPVPRGETAGAALILDGVTVQAGDRDLMSDVAWRLMPGQRAGLVGANGCGKSTLLRCLSGLRHVDAGSVRVAHGVQVGYLEQTAVGGSRRTVWAEARSRMSGLLGAERDMARAERELAAGDASAATRLEAAREAWAAAGGPESERTITNVLTGLGFRREQFHRRCSEFSGGWQMRIALARLLLGPAGQGGAGQGALLLLDEPTNHLDSAACKWLSTFLREGVPPTTSVVLVSHDEALLEGACDRMVEVRGRRLNHYVGGFAKFLEQRAAREAQARAEAESQQAEIERLETFVTRFGAKASKASQAQSKAKLLEKLRAQQTEVPAAAAAAGAGDAKKVALRLPRAPACHTEALKLVKAAVGWGAAPPPPPPSGPGERPDPSAPAPLLSGVDVTIRRGQRVLVLGPNGAGKSTLLKALAGSLPLWGGERKTGDGVRMAVFSQDLAQDLPLEEEALDYVQSVARKHDPGVTLERCRAALGALGLTGTMALQRIGVLSGGEKARVALAAFALVPANVLLLDEASNHLDAQTIQVLTGALREFDGAIVAITHNQAFAASLEATHILRVRDGSARLEDNLGLSAADFDHEPRKARPAGGQAAAAAASTAQQQQQQQQQQRSGPVQPAGGAAAKGGKKGGRGSGGSGASGRAAASAPASSAPSPAASRSPSTSASSSRSSAPASASLSSLSPSAAAAAAAAKPAAKPAAAKPAAAKPKRTTLSYNEQLEYQKLGAAMAALGAKRVALEAALAAGGGGVAALEKTANELAKVASELESSEVRWLELAEIAGDI